AEQILVVAVVGVEVPTGRQTHRHPQLRLIRPGEIRAHHADYLIRLLVQLNGAPDNRGITSKTLLPRRVSKNHFMISVRLILFWTEDAAKMRFRPKNIKPLPGDLGTHKAHRCNAVHVVIEVGAGHDGGESESICPQNSVAEVWRRNIDV